ncbi:hypothetical protein B7P43_G02350 [Cryptotermes secundus]|uniref:Calcitonin receptor n=1 Tax=Cryptotermes secundus TaxID=105785 RepID=A0A2J7RB34_9NEOP|nr:hypothetical protein B7P43_G02350 [Cryptotermes secundus]
MLITVALLSRVVSRNSSVPLCRLQDELLPEMQFQRVSCSRCYKYMHESNFKPGLKAKVAENMGLTIGNITVEANIMPSNPLIHTFVSDHAAEKWRKCCIKAAECCREMIEVGGITNESDWCPGTWDGWLCWPDTPPHTSQQQPCPTFIRFGTTDDNCQLTVRKSCERDGRWRGHPRNQNIQWTDYSSCSVHSLMERRLYMGVAAYAITAIALLPALVIFHLYRQLHGHRIALHKNLFTSLLFNAVFEIWFKTGVLLTAYDDTDSGKESVLKQNGPYCKLILLLTKYFRLTNYIWMFCEGFYLHRLISTAFAEERSLILFYVIGWGFPLLPVLVYALLRKFYSDEDCWALPTDPSEWVLNVPSLLSLLVNMVFLVNIIRVLVIKLRAPHHHEPSQYRKAVKATLVLVPLFGLHFGITMYRPQSGICQWQELYIYLDILLDGLQGAAVALIFCYVNGEVHSLMRRSYRNFLELRNPSLSAGQCLGGSTVTTTQTAF